MRHAATFANSNNTRRTVALAALVAVAASALGAVSWAGDPADTTANHMYILPEAFGTSGSSSAATITISNQATNPECGRTLTCFDPHVTAISRGQSITWHNPTSSLHVIVAGSPGNIGSLLDTGVMPPGETKNTTLDTPGEHQYFCVVHPWMTGAIHVTDSPAPGDHTLPKQQGADTHPENTKCGANRHLAYRTLDASPICLTEAGLREFARRGLAIPDDASITSDRIESDKEVFVSMLLEYMGHDDTVVTTNDVDDIEEYDYKIDYKTDMIEWILYTTGFEYGVYAESLRPTAPRIGNIITDDSQIISDSGSQAPWAGSSFREGGSWESESFALQEELHSAGAPAYPPAYSQTNIQVAGVDEPDFVKNDADSIYVIAQNDNIAMIDVDGSTGRMLAPGISPYVEGAEYMLLHQDVLAVLAYDGSLTTVTLLDVSSGITMLAKLGLESELRDARMIGDTVYVMTTSYRDEPPVLHDLLWDARDDSYEIHFFKSGMVAEELYTITAIPLADTSQSRSSSFVMGETDTAYVSRDNVYITHYQQEHELPKALFGDGLFFRYVIGTLEPYELAQLYETAHSDDLEDMAELVATAFEDKDVAGIVAELESRGVAVRVGHDYRTAIHKIAVDGTDIRYEATGVVDGVLADSFALNQGDDGMLRVMTSVGGNWQRQQQLSSSVYTLDEQMDIVGALEGIAPGETLHSTRFSGDWLYAVTFRQVDPFFVIDVSDAEPKILGVLKIPGYSEYLQNYDDTHVIGIGRDTNLNEFDTTEDAGIKISMFDVSDFENPTELQSIIVGDHSTDSAGLVEHKSLLIDDDKGILSIPIRFGNELFFYVYSVSDAYTMDIHSKIPHEYDEKNPNHMRSLYIGDTLYTVTPKMIKANDLLQPDMSIGRIGL